MNVPVDDRVVEWLLDGDDAALRYRVLTELLDLPSADPEARNLRAAIPGRSAAREILAARNEQGHWDAEPEGTYFPKYTSTHWQAICLSELRVAPDEPGVQSALARMAPALEAVANPAATDLEHCYSGNSIYYLAHLGSPDDPRIRGAIANLARLDAERGLTCELSYRKACLWGCVKVLRGLAALPDDGRSATGRALAARYADYFLGHWPALPDMDQTADWEPGWTMNWYRFGFPCFYQSDLLDAAEALVGLGYAGDQRVWALGDVILGKRQSDGRWLLENSFVGRMHVIFEPVGQPSRWITFRALKCLRAMGALGWPSGRHAS